MLRYYEVLLYTVIPPIALLAYLYSPLFGRRDGLKIFWLALMATLWTTPWDNWIISRSTWTYPSHSVLFTIFYVPIEEHAFFILQPTFLILLHSIFTLPHMLPYPIPQYIRNARPEEMKNTMLKHGEFSKLQTLRRRPWVAAGWIALMFLGFALLFWPSTCRAHVDTKTALTHILQHGLTLNGKSHVFYLGCILAWISPVIALLTGLGARSWDSKGGRWTYVVGIPYLWMADTVGIRSNAWHITEQTTLGINLWRGLPIEEAIFFVLTTHLILLSSSLISHLHHLLLLSPPSYYPSRCPPRNPIRHIVLLARLAFDPPKIDVGVLQALCLSEDTLRKGSKSFTLAKLGWEREIRCGLVAVYGWCRITDNLIDESISQQESQRMLSMMKVFLDLVYAPAASGDKKAVDHFMCENVPETAIPAFYLFSRLLPGIIPRHAFDDLIQGYEMDLSFSLANETEGSRSSTNERSPIKTQDDLILYADRVAGSVADMICHLAWAILEDEQGRIPDPKRKKILGKAREMGQALQLVNVARDIRTDALLRRLYIPLDTFTNRQEDLKALFDIAEARPSIDYAQYTLPLLFTANKLRQGSAHDIERLPRTARAGTRAMVASYFEIGKEVERRGGRLEVERLKVSKWRRIGAVLACFWGWGIS